MASRRAQESGAHIVRAGIVAFSAMMRSIIWNVFSPALVD